MPPSSWMLECCDPAFNLSLVQETLPQLAPRAAIPLWHQSGITSPGLRGIPFCTIVELYVCAQG